jgi:hypothetical protein
VAKSFPSWWRWALLTMAAAGVWQLAHVLTARPPSTERLINQLWVERMPAHPRDMVWHFVAIDRSRDNLHVGALGQASSWRVQSDGFVWRLKGDQFAFVTPQNRCRSTFTARTWKCGGEAPKPFDLCLDLAGDGKRFRYYSRKDWAINPRGQLKSDGLPAFAAPAVQAALAAAAEPDEDADAAHECPAGPH